MPVALLVVAGASLVAKLVLAAEYPWWGARLSAFLIHLAALLVPQVERARCQREWLAEADALRADGVPGVLFGAGVLVAGMRLRVGMTSRRVRAGRSPRLHAMLTRIGDIAVAASIGVIEASSAMRYRFPSSLAVTMGAAFGASWMFVILPRLRQWWHQRGAGRPSAESSTSPGPQ